MICPVCQQEVGDTGLGTPLPHRRGDSEEYCPDFVPKTFVTEPSDTANLPIDEYEGKRTPREGYIAATPDWLPLIRTFEEARDLATRCCAQGEPSYVFHVIPIRKLESGIKETRLGRVRRQKAKS